MRPGLCCHLLTPSCDVMEMFCHLKPHNCLYMSLECTTSISEPLEYISVDYTNINKKIFLIPYLWCYLLFHDDHVLLFLETNILLQLLWHFMMMPNIYLFWCQWLDYYLIKNTLLINQQLFNEKYFILGLVMYRNFQS